MLARLPPIARWLLLAVGIGLLCFGIAAFGYLSA
jgi:hypothetical protein